MWKKIGIPHRGTGSDHSPEDWHVMLLAPSRVSPSPQKNVYVLPNVVESATTASTIPFTWMSPPNSTVPAG